MNGALQEINDVQWPAEQVAFMQEFCKNTGPVSGKKARLWESKVEIDLSFCNEHWLSGDNIRALEPQNGHGLQAIDWLTDLAKKHQVAIFVNAVPEYISETRWKTILEQRGFSRMGGTGMCYQP